VANALYLRTPFVKALKAQGWGWVINLKDNQPELLAEAQRTTGGKPITSSLTTRSRSAFGTSPVVLGGGRSFRAGAAQ